MTVTDFSAQLYLELWVSLASLLRSYTAAYGLNGNRQATVELGEEEITVRHADKWLALKRNGSQIRWQREDGQAGTLEFTEAGRLKSSIGPSSSSEEEMDLRAEAWARELMQ
ncbi:MAG TPA: transcriptional regulator [Terracidiphilus sp.]